VLQNLKWVLLLVLALLFIWFIWPTPYRYFDAKEIFGLTEIHGCREHRVTGDISCLVPGTDGHVGWVVRE
jgi:hypothetical protein